MPYDAIGYAANVLDREMPPSERIQSVFEFWPRWVFYFPLFLQWLALSFRYRSLTLPTLVNPRIETGGLCGESKTQIFSLLGDECRKCFAPYASLMRSASRNVEADLTHALAAMQETGLSFPVIAKPDISCQGAGVRLLSDMNDLRRYLAAFPRKARFLLQHWVSDPGEAGVFYMRDPAADRGFIFSITLKYFPSVTGNGRSMVSELIRGHRRAKRIAGVYLSRLGEKSRYIPGYGEKFHLVLTGNHCKGAVFRDGSHLATPALIDRFDRLARDIPHFYFGRFDVRFSSLDEFRRGNFTIIEVNGAGSEATHIWDPNFALADAYRTLFRQLRFLFEFADRNRKLGLRPTPLPELLRLYVRQQKLMKAYPLSQ